MRSFRRDDLNDFSTEKFKEVENFIDFCKITEAEEEELTKFWEEYDGSFEDI